MYEGDMILTPEQRMAADLGMDVDNPLGRGSTIGRQWPSGVVPYVIDDSLGKLKICQSVTHDYVNRHYLRHHVMLDYENTCSENVFCNRKILGTPSHCL